MAARGYYYDLYTHQFREEAMQGALQRAAREDAAD